MAMFSDLQRLNSTQQKKRENNQISGKPENQNSGNPEVRKSSFQEIPESGKDENQKTRKNHIKFSTQLTPDSITAVKRIALDEGKKDYEIVQEAIDRYLKKRGV